MNVQYREKALAQLLKLSLTERKRILDKIDFFAEQEQPLDFAKRLTGHESYRFRIGNYRAIFDIEEGEIVVLLVVKREGAYRNL
ncbi:hypothetical protein A3C89_02600 [Candidatus Kaiserbacteria bacterium RIFCSPHIGHO2_02_FULL_50_50]|uniref:Plasmid stabilization protein n=1 Tax=Candidatus Kaiserbacteria bacterium RIFCSPHIGHO2_02_FULL_50_50 TaxID=1798492 RepID=A0A1F6DD68_9BACT|nr:MAG: hypothetical protein A3C89_02600 [Candidatus Kaiserbacteria bacterium RIFCSPHIGHO2_02_FULL_50_50]OGG88003.1 MAG: hypothetical protein A3G62_03615 [Candidatus Kaiserbacteria bacterium RIFCSPLOWO2_12_FULL_50_10]